ncbi:DUF6668 family protein [Jidongwangia harbinensis]|uniref:DUF6668 family protein n=1 Tax=Jidongwangia harbinensis TaxID=2878561 RepID=UPI001CD92BE4|nr:DUF6668 family protein [Jidongwangia harbinensis]MCA2211834.1 hypothetical protein [Jidongwangia harbinensis]
MPSSEPWPGTDTADEATAVRQVAAPGGHAGPVPAPAPAGAPAMPQPAGPGGPGDEPQWQPHQPRQRRAAPVEGLSAGGVCWVAAHGGAGTTTLAAVLGGVDLGCRWPDPARDEPASIILVARTHAQGLRAASRALNAIREGRHPAGMRLAALVLVADAPGRLPRPLVSRLRMLRAVAPVYRIPWVPQWRLGKKVDRPPRQVVKLGQLARAVQQGAVR